MSVTAAGCLEEERKQMRKEVLDPRSSVYKFITRQAKRDDGTLDLFKWECAIPGLKNTPWQDGLYELTMVFPEDYPASPPKCRFKPQFFHPNVFSSGLVCLSILYRRNDSYGWKPTLSIKEVLLGIQFLLNEPNIKDAAQLNPYLLCRDDRAAYERRIREQALEFSDAEIREQMKH